MFSLLEYERVQLTLSTFLFVSVFACTLKYVVALPRKHFQGSEHTKNFSVFRIRTDWIRKLIIIIRISFHSYCLNLKIVKKCNINSFCKDKARVKELSRIAIYWNLRHFACFLVLSNLSKKNSRDNNFKKSNDGSFQTLTYLLSFL
jgi:hypothetical protein